MNDSTILVGASRQSGFARSARMVILALLFCLTVVHSLSGCSAARIDTTIQASPEIVEAKGRYLKQYLLLQGDRIEISVWQVPEVSRTVEIRPDGKISLPTVSNIRAAGLTFEELEEELTERLSVRLRDPLVTVIAVDIRKTQVYVLGDVVVQRPVPLRDATTAMEAITLAGGFLRSSAVRDVSIIRLGDDGILRAIPVDLASRGQPSPYLSLGLIRLQPDDIVFVPERKRSETIRWLDDFIGRPLSYLNAAAGTILAYRIVADF